MPCPTCQHTMHNLGVEGQRIFWCPRCGTIKSEAPNAPDNINVPYLVGRVREAETMTVCTSVDGRSIQYAVPGSFWRTICIDVGIKAHEPPTGFDTWTTATAEKGR